MSRILKIALTGLMMLLTTLLAVPVFAAARQFMESSPSGYHVMFIPIIIMIVYILLGGALSIAFLIWAFNHHVWPFDGSWFHS